MKGNIVLCTIFIILGTVEFTKSDKITHIKYSQFIRKLFMNEVPLAEFEDCDEFVESMN